MKFYRDSVVHMETRKLRSWVLPAVKSEDQTTPAHFAACRVIYLYPIRKTLEQFDHRPSNIHPGASCFWQGGADAAEEDERVHNTVQLLMDCVADLIDHEGLDVLPAMTQVCGTYPDVGSRPSGEYVFVSVPVSVLMNRCCNRIAVDLC